MWATPVYASLMVESTADDHLTVDGVGDAPRRPMFGFLFAQAQQRPKQKVFAVSLGVMDTGS